MKLAVSSLVCTVADKASAQNLSERAMGAQRVERQQRAEAVKKERDLNVELRETKAIVATIQEDLNTTKGAQQKAIADLAADLIEQIKELRTMAVVRSDDPRLVDKRW